MPFKHMNDKTFFITYKENYFTSGELAWAPHYEYLLHIYIKYDKSRQNWRNKNELCKFHNFVDLKSNEEIGHNVKAHAHVIHESIPKS